jgi:hypothetical protein
MNWREQNPVIRGGVTKTPINRDRFGLTAFGNALGRRPSGG